MAQTGSESPASSVHLGIAEHAWTRRRSPVMWFVSIAQRPTWNLRSPA